MITKKTFNFLKQIAKSNNRDWFEKNRAFYEESYLEMQTLADAVNKLMSEHDQIIELSPKKSIFRIYRDVRFSKDKTPYKNHWGGRIKRDTSLLRGGYYYHVEPGNSFAAAGFWGPESKDLKLIRSHLAQDVTEINSLNQGKAFRAMFPDGIQGSELKKAPQGYDVGHPSIEWLRKKQFVVRRFFTDKEVVDPGFARQIDETYRAVRPFFNYMSEILTTNLNGEPLYD